MPFEPLAKMLHSETVVKVTAKLLKRFNRLSANKQEWKTPARIFLSAFMMISHPQEIMDIEGEEEGILLTKSKRMVNDFEAWFSGYASESAYELLMAAFKSWSVYYALFNDWKEKDTIRLIDSLVESWMDLEALWISVKNQVVAVIFVSHVRIRNGNLVLKCNKKPFTPN